jgi:hypothetical protein
MQAVLENGEGSGNGKQWFIYQKADIFIIFLVLNIG